MSLKKYLLEFPHIKSKKKSYRVIRKTNIKYSLFPGKDKTVEKKEERTK